MNPSDWFIQAIYIIRYQDNKIQIKKKMITFNEINNLIVKSVLIIHYGCFNFNKKNLISKKSLNKLSVSMRTLLVCVHNRRDISKIH